MFLIVIISERTNLKRGLNLQYNIRLHDKNHHIHRNTTLQCPDNTTPIHHNRTKHNSYCSASLQFIRLRHHSTSSRRSYRILDAIFVPNRHIPSFQREQMPAQRQVAQYDFTQAYRGPRTRGEVSCARMAGWSLTRFFPVARCSRDLSDTRNSSGCPAARNIHTGPPRTVGNL